MGKCKYTAAVIFAPPPRTPLVQEVLTEVAPLAALLFNENVPEISLQVYEEEAEEGAEGGARGSGLCPRPPPGSRKLDKNRVTSPMKISSLNRSESMTSILTVPRLQYEKMAVS